MSHNESHIGTIGWILLGIGVATWDYTQEESLSHAFRRGMEHPIYKYMCIGMLGTTALHLTGILPEYVDPFYLAKLERDD